MFSSQSVLERVEIIDISIKLIYNTNIISKKSYLPINNWTTHLTALIPQDNQPAVLGIFTAAGLVLPQASLTEQISQSQIDRVQIGLRTVCQIPFNMLYCLAFADNPKDNRTDALYLLEAREDGFTAGELPPGLGWIHLDELRSDMVPESLSSKFTALLEEWKAKAGQELTWQMPPLSAPWTRPGWYAQAEGWITVEMANLGKSVRAIEPLKSWSISAVLRVQTAARPVFFKASLDLPLFVNEGVVMAGLAQLYPQHVPTPLAVEAARGWMLLEDLGEPLGREALEDQKEGLFRAMAHLQIDSSHRLDQLLRLGCIDRRIPWLQSHLEALLVDDISLSQVPRAEREELTRAVPRLQRLLSELNSLPIPPALNHGDLHTGNVALRDGEMRIFDWTDAAISHPFFDLDEMISTEDPGLREKLGDAYLSVWEEVYPVGAVRRAFDLARVVYGLYHAVSYQFILNNLEEADRPEINATHYFVRQVLAGLAMLP